MARMFVAVIVGSEPWFGGDRYAQRYLSSRGHRRLDAHQPHVRVEDVTFDHQRTPVAADPIPIARAAWQQTTPLACRCLYEQEAVGRLDEEVPRVR